MTKPRSFFEHRFIDGKPVGLRTTVERLKYLGYVDGKPAYELTEMERWKAAFVTLVVGLALVALTVLVRHLG